MLSETDLRVERQRATRPIDDNHIQIAGLEQFILHFGYPIGQGRIDEAVYDEFRTALCAKIGCLNAVGIIGADRLANGWILFRVQNETCIDHTAGQWKYVERTMN